MSDPYCRDCRYWDPMDPEAIDGECHRHAPRMAGTIAPHAWWKPQTDPDLARRDLVKAAALIVAEIERIDRALSRGDYLTKEGR